MLKKVSMIVSMIFLLSGCISEKSTSIEELPKIESDLFMSPNFQINDFSINIENKNNLIINFDYTYSPELNSSLEMDDSFYFKFEFPEEVKEITTLENSSKVERENINSDTELYHSTRIETKLPKILSDSEIEKIENELLGYNLLIKDINDLEIHKFVNVIYMLNKINAGNTNEDATITVGTPIVGDGMFYPPNFLVTTFNVSVTDENSLNIAFDYSYSPVLYKTLKYSDNFYFQFEFPPEIINITSIEKTELQLSENLDPNGHLNYKTIIETKLPKELTIAEREIIENNLLGYNLTILDSDKYPVHHFLEVYYMLNINSNDSIFQEVE